MKNIFRNFVNGNNNITGNTVTNSSIIQSNNKTIVNGIEIEGNFNSVSVRNGKIYLDGKLYVPEEFKKENKEIQVVQVIINGDIGILNTEGDAIIKGSVSGNVDAGGDIEIKGNVFANVSAGGDIEVNQGTIKGNAIAGGDITNYK